MNSEQEVRFMIGDLLVQAITLKHQLQAAQAKIAELEAKKEEPPKE